MERVKRTAVAGLLALVLGSCGFFPVAVRHRDLEPPVDGDRSLVFLHISGVPIDYAWFKHADAVDDKKSWFSTRTKRGLIYVETLPLGSFHLVRYGFDGASGFGCCVTMNDTVTRYSMQEFGPSVALVRIEKPGVYYLGSFRHETMKKESRWTGRPGSFDLVRVEQPTERELLLEMLPHAKATAWEERIQRRLQELEAKQ